MSIVLLKTKLYVPAARLELVARPHLIDRLNEGPVEKPIGLVESLSEREIEVLQLVTEGPSNQEIAARLYLSLRTIKFHTSNIYGKLGVKSRTEAIAKARDLGLLSS